MPPCMAPFCARRRGQGDQAQATGVATMTTDTPKSWAPEVIADPDGKWVGNRLRFATQQEAEGNVRDLFRRWTLVTETRVVQSNDPANYRWDAEKGLVDL